MIERIGRYRVLGPVGEGGMGRVFLAEVTAAGGFQRRVVLKQVLDRSNDGMRRGLLDEARIQATLVHKNIVPVLDLVEHEGEHFVVLEHIDGLDLRRLLQLHGPLPWPFVLHIGLEIAAGLDYVHRRKSVDDVPLGLIHRDVTPANILCSWEGEVKLTDFGIAQTGSQQGDVAGNFAYVAPEQAAGGEIDATVDLYALGVVLHEALTGTRPREGDHELTAIPDALAPVELRAAITNAMSRDPARRPQSAARLRESLLACPKQLVDTVPPFVRLLDELRPRLRDRSGLLRLVEAGRSFTRRVLGTSTAAADTIVDRRPARPWPSFVLIGVALACSIASALWWRARHREPVVAGATTHAVAPATSPPKAPVELPSAALPEVAPDDAPPARRPPARPGTLSVNAIPWARLWIDDRALGHTPRLGISLVPGRHRVRLQTSRGDERQRSVEIRSGKESKLTVLFSEP
jgi:hypothetical protein